MTSTVRRPPDTEVQAAASSSSSSSAATLPPSHPISQRIRSILIQPSHDELATKRALDTVAAIYSNQRPVATSAPRDSIARLPAVPIDTERARKNLERDSRKRLHKATNDFISVLQTVDDVSVASTMNHSALVPDTKLLRRCKSSNWMCKVCRAAVTRYSRSSMRPTARPSTSSSTRKGCRSRGEFHNTEPSC